MYPLIHRKTTSNALRKEFSDRILTILCKANMDSDNLRYMRFPAQHFTNSNIEGGIFFINQLEEIVMEEFILASKSRSSIYENQNRDIHLINAVYALGRIFHAIQDFYSHSNWINLTGPKVQIWKEQIIDEGLPEPYSLKTCQGGTIRYIIEYFGRYHSKDRLSKDKRFFKKYSKPDNQDGKMSHFELGKDGNDALSELVYRYHYKKSAIGLIYQNARKHTSLKWNHIKTRLREEISGEAEHIFDYLRIWEPSIQLISQSNTIGRSGLDNRSFFSNPVFLKKTK